jgi:flagellar biosynthesis/type III secretory pathway protein FliH
MKERILKGEQAKQGDQVVVAARQLSQRQFDSGHDAQSGRPSEQPSANPGASEQHSAEARSAAEQIVADAEQMAQEIAEQAKQEASRKREEIESEIEQLIDSTTRELETQRESIERETRQRVEAEYRERYLAAITALEQAAADLRTRREAYLEEIEQPAFQLVLEVARQLLLREPSRTPAFVAALITRALAILKPEQLVTVSLNPDVLRTLSEDKTLSGALSAAGLSPSQVELAGDSSLQPGQFRARCDGSAVDYDLATAIAELIRQLEHQAELPAAAEGDGEDV